MARVELEKVSKVFSGGIQAVDEVDLSIADQEFVVLVGPSGCGKSTTLRMVAGLEEVTGGVIRIGDRVVNHVPPKDRDIAMVFQNYALYPHMTVFKNMAFALTLRRAPRDEIRRRVTEAATILDIVHLLDRKPRELSGGQRQRVAVGRAIVREPKAFLFDEPLSNLDAKLRVTTRAELKRLHQRLRTTTIYVTHDQEEAMTLGDRIVVMRDGRIQQADAPLAVYGRPANRFVAGFIGMPPMNFFDGVIRHVDGRLIFEEGRLERRSRGGSGSGDGHPKSDEAAVADGELTVPGGGFSMPVPAHLRTAVSGRVGQHVVLGIRPENFHLRDMVESCPVSVKLNVIEPLGNDMDVYFQTALTSSLVGRMEAEGDLKCDSQATLHVDVRKVHFFEPGVTGMNLSLNPTVTHALA